MSLIIPIYILVILIFASINKVDAYSSFIEGIKKGYSLVISIFPFFLSMIFATKIMIESGLFHDIFVALKISFKYGNEILLQGLFRPLSSNASMSMLLEVFDKYGVNSKSGILSSIVQGSTDTTLYIITLYFGSVGVIHYKKAMYLGLLVDLFAFLVSVLIVYTMV